MEGKKANSLLFKSAPFLLLTCLFLSRELTIKTKPGFSAQIASGMIEFVIYLGQLMINFSQTMSPVLSNERLFPSLKSKSLMWFKKPTIMFPLFGQIENTIWHVFKTCNESPLLFYGWIVLFHFLPCEINKFSGISNHMTKSRLPHSPMHILSPHFFWHGMYFHHLISTNSQIDQELDVANSFGLVSGIWNTLLIWQRSKMLHVTLFFLLYVRLRQTRRHYLRHHWPDMTCHSHPIYRW